MSTLGPGYEEARAIFESIATRPDYVEFLTLPAYDRLAQKRLLARRQRVRPPQPPEPAEVLVGRAQLVVFDREGGEVRIGDEIARCAQRFEELAHENEMPLSPATNVRRLRCYRTGERAGRADTQGMSARFGLSLGLMIAAVAVGGWRMLIPGADSASNDVSDGVSALVSTTMRAAFTGAQASLDAQRNATGS